MADLNNISLVGRLTKDAKYIVSESGYNIHLFTLAVNFFVKGKEDVMFINCTHFSKTDLSQYLLKGYRIGVTGKLIVDRYQDTNGNNREVYKVVVGDIGFYQDKKNNDNSSNTDTNNYEPIDDTGDEDEAPF